MTSSDGPTITPMQWATAKEVLPHEAHHFTPWLAGNLDLLAGTLGLDNLELVATEWKVETFALDILARGVDADGEVHVVIENQYGDTDHRHLGQLLTYAAHAAASGHRVLAVWLTEHVRPAHQAAVEFLNRIAAEGSTFGVVLLRVRFAPAPAGWYVHFEVDAEPNAFLSQPTPGPQLPGPSAGARAAFIEEVTGHLDPALSAVGMPRSGSINHRHGAVVYRFPATLEVAKLATARVVCSAEFTNVALYIQKYPDTARNWAVAELLRRTYEPLLAQHGISVDTWHGSGPNVKRDRVITTLPAGYAGGDAATVAAGAAQVFSAWTQMLTDHPLTGLAAAVEVLAGEADDYDWGDTASHTE